MRSDLPNFAERVESVESHVHRSNSPAFCRRLPTLHLLLPTMREVLLVGIEAKRFGHQATGIPSSAARYRRRNLRDRQSQVPINDYKLRLIYDLAD